MANSKPVLPTALPAEKVILEKVQPRYHVVQNFTYEVALTDFVAAAATATCSSMPVSIIDKAIMEAMLNRAPSVGYGLGYGVKTLMLRPHKFFIPNKEHQFHVVYWLVFLTYVTTYASGNLTQSYFEAQEKSFYLPKFTAGSFTNIGFTLLKDNMMLSVLAVSKNPVPNFARFLILSRDVLTVLASFVLAPMLGKEIHKKVPNLLTPKQASDVADLLVPTSAQAFTTILHLYAIGMKEFPKDSPRQLVKRIRSQYFAAFRARVLRIGISFGVGMIVNKRVRDYGLVRVDKKKKHE